MAGSNRKSGTHTTKVIDVVNNHRSAPIQRSDKWQLMGSAEHKLVEEALRKTEQEKATILNGMSEVVVYHDIDMRILWANRAAGESVGLAPEQLVGHHCYEIWHQRSQPCAGCPVVRAYETGQPEEAEIATPDGRVWFVRGHPVRDANGGLVGMVELVLDITERKKAEEQLTRLSNALGMSTDSIVISDLKAKIVDVNEATLKMYGTDDKKTLIGKNSLELIAPEEQEKALEGMRGALQKGYIKEREYHIVTKDGDRILVEMSVALLKDTAGKPTGFVAVSRDITERKRVELEYKTILQTTVDGFWLTDTRGRFLDVNDAYCRLVGYNRDELLKMSIPDVEAIEKPEEIAARIAKVRKVGGDRFETHHRRKDGTIVDVEISVNYIELAGGRMCVLVRDITDRKLMEEALKESEEKYRSLVNDISLGIFRSTPGPRGKFLEVNPAMERITGYSREELLQIDVCDLYQHPEERQQVLEEIAAATGMASRETRFRKKDGTEIVVSDTKVAVRDDAGQIIYFDGITEDITKRKKVEEQIKRAAEEWRTTFDSITDWVSIVDKDFKLVRVNKAFADAFGKRPRDLIGKTCYQVVHKTNEPVRDCPRRKTLQTKRPAAVEFFEPSLEMYLEARTSPIFDEKGQVIACIEVTTDVTERKRMQEQLMLSHRLASLGELVSGVAHELNNPLTSVIGFSQLLMEGEIADDVREDLSLVHSEAQRAADIVKNLLTFARKRAPTKQLTRINNIIEDVLKLRAYWQRVNNIEVRRQFASDLPEIMADFVQMQQVFLNIIINAEYFMIQAHNRGTLTITTKKVGDVIRISLADDGPGIAKENLTRIFDPFFTTKEVGVGTGLGLSICHGIVNAHGGRIYARSQLGEGATFVVELPINSP